MKNFNVKGIVISIAVLVGLLTLFAIIFNDEPPINSKEQPKETPDIFFTEYGYTKGPDRYRLMVYEYMADSTLSKDTIQAHLRRHAKNRMHTPGRSTSIYYYDGKHPPKRTFRTAEKHRRFLNQYSKPAAVFMILPDGSLVGG